MRHQRLTILYKELLQRHGSQGWWPLQGVYSPKNTTKSLTKDERFEISVGAILTQNTAWVNVEKALDNLRQVNVLNEDSLLALKEEQLATLVKPAGYYNQKAKKLKYLAQFLQKKKPVTREALLQLWGIGPETADSILLYAYRKPVFVVDAYTRRVCQPCNFFSPRASYSEVQAVFMNHLPHDHRLFNEFHALLVAEAKQRGK